jgi:hypothetical protein
MTRFEETQHAFAAALRDPDLPPPDGIAGYRRQLRRFNVYRNNVYAGLIRVLEARYPAVQRLVGDEFFKAMSRIFVDKAPPASPVLLEYGGTYPEFLEAFEPVSDEPYLADLARLEWALHRARHAADVTPLRASDLAAFQTENTYAIRIGLAPAVSVQTSPYPIFSLWRAHVVDEPSGDPQAFSGAESVFVTRPGLVAEAIRIPRSCGVFIAALLDDKTLGAASAAAFAVDPSFPLERTVALLIAQKAIVSIETDEHPEQESTP